MSRTALAGALRTAPAPADDLIGACRGLIGASEADDLSAAEQALLGDTARDADLDAIRLAIVAGEDPLGELLVGTRTKVERRAIGQFLTPWPIVRHMVRQAIRPGTRAIVDAGCGSGRFAIEAARERPEVPVFAIDLDPLATLVTRANAAVLGLRNVTVINESFLTWELPPIDGSVAYLSNPPYVRHHDLTADVKRWGAETARVLGHEASSLSGLHAYFLLATAAKARAGDRGCFITSAEWLDVGYGSLMRSLLTNGLGLELLELLDAKDRAFDDAMTTSVVTTFQAGRSVHAAGLIVERVSALGHGRSDPRPIDASALRASQAWTRLIRSGASPDPGHVELGTYVRVSRGMVTGANPFFVMTRRDAAERGLEPWVEPVISDAREVQAAARDGRFEVDRLRVVLIAPADVPDDDRHAPLRRYLDDGAAAGYHGGYIASRRRPWWNLGRLPRPPIIATYMSRSGPVFARNPGGLPILNVAHGLYPHEPMPDAVLDTLASLLNRDAQRFVGSGRTYHGGLEKFEPREMERLLIPPLSART